jgi:hypothetical protein
LAQKGPLKTPVIAVASFAAHNNDKVPTTFEAPSVQAAHLTQLATQAIAHYGAAHFFAHREAKSHRLTLVAQAVYNQFAPRNCFPGAKDVAELSIEP